MSPDGRGGGCIPHGKQAAARAVAFIAVAGKNCPHAIGSCEKIRLNIFPPTAYNPCVPSSRDDIVSVCKR